MDSSVAWKSTLSPWPTPASWPSGLRLTVRTYLIFARSMQPLAFLTYSSGGISKKCGGKNYKLDASLVLDSCFIVIPGSFSRGFGIF